MGTFSVNNHSGEVVVASYSGEMTMEIVEEAAKLIEHHIVRGARRVLYDARQMSDPDISLAMFMKNFAGRMGKLVDRSATVVPTAKTAFMSRIAFSFQLNHKVFYNDLGGALNYLDVPGELKTSLAG